MTHDEDVEHMRMVLQDNQTIREVRIANLEELAKMHVCNQEEVLKEIATDLISQSSAMQELSATMQTYMQSHTDILTELKQLSKANSDMILIHNTKCPHPEEWSSIWKSVEALKREFIDFVRESEQRRMTIDHKQDLEIKELMVKAEHAGRNSGAISGGGLAVLISTIVAFAIEHLGGKTG